MIDLDSEVNVKITRFPDGQPHVNLTKVLDNESVRCSINSCEKLLILLETANALDNAGVTKNVLYIHYLLGARYDRLMNDGDSVDLKVIANLINSLGFNTVSILCPHSSTALQLINRSEERKDGGFVNYVLDNSVLICPDAGAIKNTDFIVEYSKQYKKNISDIVYCIKKRDLTNGKISLEVLEPEKCVNRNCIIIDDICDGGATFNAIASQIKPKHLTLYVTHGIFSKGFDELNKNFDSIVCTNSLRKQYPFNDKLTVTNV